MRSLLDVEVTRADQAQRDERWRRARASVDGCGAVAGPGRSRRHWRLRLLSQHRVGRVTPRPCP